MIGYPVQPLDRFRLSTIFLEDIPQCYCYKNEGGKEDENELHTLRFLFVLCLTSVRPIKFPIFV